MGNSVKGALDEINEGNVIMEVSIDYNITYYSNHTTPTKSSSHSMHVVHDPAVSQARWDIAEQHLPKLCVRTGINAVEPENAIEWVAICEYKRIHGTDVIKKCLVSSYCTPIWVCFPINIKETNRHKKANKVSYLISSNLKSLLFSLSHEIKRQQEMLLNLYR